MKQFFPLAAGTACVWRVLGQVEEASIALLPLHLRCQEGKAWFVRSQTPSGGHL